MQRVRLWKSRFSGCDCCIGADDKGDLVDYDTAQAEIDVTYGKAFVAGKKNGEATMQDEIDELVGMLADLADHMYPHVSSSFYKEIETVIAKHRGK